MVAPGRLFTSEDPPACAVPSPSSPPRCAWTIEPSTLRSGERRSVVAPGRLFTSEDPPACADPSPSSPPRCAWTIEPSTLRSGERRSVVAPGRLFTLEDPPACAVPLPFSLRHARREAPGTASLVGHDFNHRPPARGRGGRRVSDRGCYSGVKRQPCSRAGRLSPERSVDGSIVHAQRGGEEGEGSAHAFASPRPLQILPIPSKLHPPARARLPPAPARWRRRRPPRPPRAWRCPSRS